MQIQERHFYPGLKELDCGRVQTTDHQKEEDEGEEHIVQTMSGDVCGRSVSFQRLHGTTGTQMYVPHHRTGHWRGLLRKLLKKSTHFQHWAGERMNL